MTTNIVNVVDRYLETMNRLGLPKFGWLAHKSKIKSDLRDIPTSFTGGFAKTGYVLRHPDVSFVIVVSDEVRDVLVCRNENTFNQRADYYRKAAKPNTKPKKGEQLDLFPVVPVTSLTNKALGMPVEFVPGIVDSLSKDIKDKVASKLIAKLDDEEAKRLEELHKKKALLKKKFDEFNWTTIGFGEAQEGTIANFTFYFGPSRSLEGKFFYKINGVRCRDSENGNTLEEVKERAFESFWLVLLAKEKKSNKPVEASAN